MSKKARNNTSSIGVRDRIKEIRLVRGADLVPSPVNWRRHPGAQRAATPFDLPNLSTLKPSKDNHLRAFESWPKSAS